MRSIPLRLGTSLVGSDGLSGRDADVKALRLNVENDVRKRIVQAVRDDRAHNDCEYLKMIAMTAPKTNMNGDVIGCQRSKHDPPGT